MATPESDPAMTAPTTGSPRRALILYASQTGTSEDLSLQLSDVLTRHHIHPTVLSCNELTPLSTLPTHALIFLLISTTGQGEMPDNAKLFWRGLLRKKLPAAWLGEVSFGVFCLGDTTYPKFCWAGRMVGRRLLQLGAKEVVPRVEADQSADEGTEGAFAGWVEVVRSVLRQKWPLMDGTEEIKDEVVLESKWVLEFAGADGEADGKTDGEADSKGEVDGMEIMRKLHAPRPGAILATVAKNERITTPEHWQDVRHLAFTLPEPMCWSPGDVLSISPKNFPADVEHLLALQNWTAIADRPLVLKPSAHLAPSEIPPCPISTPISPLTLRTLLIHHLDITSIPRRSFFSLAAHLTTDSTHKERLAEFADPQWIEELWDYTTRPRRSILEVLQEFSSIRIPLPRLLQLIPRLRPRQFSIASSSLSSPTSIELLVAIVRYKTVIKKTRLGVCTRYLASLLPDADADADTISLVFHGGSLGLSPSHLRAPVVLIAPGTGVAPMRALLQHRLLSPSPAVDNTLIFGCRSSRADYFFSSEWTSLQARGALQLLPAFSRDQPAKRYVQTVVRENAGKVWAALAERGGSVFVCGSSGRMPSAVREALVEVFAARGGMRREDAVKWLERLEKEGRYRQETW
ncbi:hypothetical protein BZA05DRAFT_405121 [Tricharina praecox]|uniref:uncharacterized protein n=1 Tax=Tricharina praecox TaxID=43433 RepID=UPI00221F5B74|nr:uncharacterized protein BZA05DRAFT_405121 [Tricharina praecox]KAI5847526.1 hypothetical protein BZA05DRAFT_405121 [Tricharina praecox]